MYFVQLYNFLENLLDFFYEWEHSSELMKKNQHFFYNSLYM